MTDKVLSKRATTLASRVMLIATTNPKKKPSQAYDRFEILRRECKDGKTPTVAALLKAGYRMDDVRHDSEHGFIALGDANIKKAQAAAERAAADALAAARALVAKADAEKK